MPAGADERWLPENHAEGADCPVDAWELFRCSLSARASGAYSGARPSTKRYKCFSPRALAGIDRLLFLAFTSSRHEAGHRWTSREVRGGGGESLGSEITFRDGSNCG